MLSPANNHIVQIRAEHELLLLVGTRLWLVALAAGIVLTSMIENIQREIPGRVPDPRDVAANSIGMFIGIALAIVLTLPAALRRRRERA